MARLCREDFVLMRGREFLEVPLSIKFTDIYKKAIVIKGDFSVSVSIASTDLKMMAFYNKNVKYKELKFNPYISYDNYRRITKENVSAKLNADTHQYYKGKSRPSSMIIVGNESYNLFTNNCLDVSITALMFGVLKDTSKQKKYDNELEHIYYYYARPNLAYNYFLSLGFGKEISIR